MPTQLDSLLGMNVPGISYLQLSAPLGQFPLLGGEQSLFVPGVAGFNVRFAIEDTYGTGPGFPAFPGMVADFLASRGPGVSYGLTIPSTPDNYVNSFASGYPGQNITPYSMLLPFTYAGVTGAYMYNPPGAAATRASSARTSRTSSSARATSARSSTRSTRSARRSRPARSAVTSSTSSPRQPVANATVLVLDATGAIRSIEFDDRRRRRVPRPPRRPAVHTSCSMTRG